MEKNIFQRLTDSVQDVVSQADKAYDGVKKVYNNAMVEDDKHENEILKNLGDSVQDLSMQLYAVKESMVYMEQHYAKALEGLNGSMKNIQSMTEEFSNRLQIIEQKIDDQSTSSNNSLQEEISSFCLTQKQIEKDLQKMGELLRLSVLNRMLDEIPNENFQKETSDDEEIKAWKEEQLKRLKPYTNDPEILKHVEWVAFDQDDLEDILHEGDTHLVYLCQNRFIFPSGILKKKDMSYIGIGGNVEVVIKSKKEVDFKSLGITFTNVRLFDNIEIEEEYQPSKLDDSSQILDVGDIMETYVEASTVISNKQGIHARPASILVQTATKFQSKINLQAKGRMVDAKSVLMIMSMQLVKGTPVTIIADGIDAREAVDALISLIDCKFGEE